MSNVRSFAYLAVASVSGALFGAGLYVSQMVDPLKVLRFLDFTAIPEGQWDPSLAVVIVAAIGVMMVGVRIAGTQSRPLFNGTFHLPAKTEIDPQLLIGAALFGVGWGMSGICPGPAISLAAFMPENLVLFLGTMFLGSLIGGFIMEPGKLRSLFNGATSKGT